jgi:hypothetical protein
VFEQEEHRLLHLGRLDDVVVVEHDDHVAFELVQLVHDGGDHGVDRGLGHLQERGRVGADGARRTERGGEVGPEQGGVVVARVE